MRQLFRLQAALARCMAPMRSQGGLHHAAAVSRPQQQHTCSALRPVTTTTAIGQQCVRHLAPASNNKCSSSSNNSFSAALYGAVSRRSVQSAAAVETASTKRSRTSTAYGAEQIQVLEGLDPVRKRPGMYIGSTGPRGLHHLLWEVLDNAVDEVQGGFGDLVTVEVDLGTQQVTITDNGRGIPTDLHPATGKSALETVLTVLHAGGKFGGGSEDDGSNGSSSSSGYRMSGGLHGVGISVVNALSQQLHVEVLRDGVLYSQSYSKGEPTTPLTEQPAPAGSYSSGTKVTFVPDAAVFSPGINFDADTVASRLRELAFLNAGATMKLRLLKHGQPLPTSKVAKQAAAAADKAQRRSKRSTSQEAVADGSNGDSAAAAAADAGGVQQDWQVFCFQDGLKEYVQWLNRDNHVLHQPAVVSAVTGQVEVSVALQWVSDTFSDTLVGFANSIKTIDGGSHLDGLKAALTRLVNTAAKRNKLVKEADPALSGDHVREGLSGVIAVKVPSPEFEGQTKTRLGNPEVRRQVDQVVTEQLGAWLDAHPAALSAIVNKALTAARAAEAARKARELVRRKSSLTSSTLPGKLADCTSNNKEESEIFIVEGDSAGGSAKQARDRRTQAILPLRGKILNVERKDDAALYKNQELAALIVALGLGTKGGSSSSSNGGSKKGKASSRRSTSSSSSVDASGAGAAAATASLDEAEQEGEASGGGGAGGVCALKGLRYGKVVLLTDADVDGAHIRTLLLTFLFRYRRELFEQGRVYVAVPPLYRVETGRNQEPRWAYDDAGLQALLADISKAKGAAAAAAAAAGTAAAGQQAAAKGGKGRRSSRASTKSAGAAVGDAVSADGGELDAAAGEEAAAAGNVAAPAAAAAAVAAMAALPPGVSVTRFKGLGEMMPEQLWSTTLNPETRVLRRLTLEDAAAASHTFVTLMGDKVAPRRALIEAEGQKYTLEQLDI